MTLLVRNDYPITRVFEMPNKDTFRLECIQKFIKRYFDRRKVWVDPMARNSVFKKWCKFTNDLNTKFETTHNMEAYDFFHLFKAETVDGVLFDPPYSATQIKRAYANVGIKATFELCKTTFYGKLKDEIARVLKPGGICLTFCWNTTGLGSGRGFDTLEIMIVNHGARHNDTLCMAERKRSVGRLDEWNL